MIVKAKLDPDGNGFTTQQCKNDGCEKYFKVKLGKGSKRGLVFCPYCNFQGGFWTIAQLKYFHSMADPSSGQSLMPKETNKLKKQFEFPCHKESIKHDDSQDYLFCIICGDEHQID
jgi:transcription elongation factor Elf1